MDNRGYLKRNTDKKGENSPDFKGAINIGGCEYWLAGWVKEKEGRKYFSLSVKPKGHAEAPRQLQQAAEEPDDGIPF